MGLMQKWLEKGIWIRFKWTFGGKKDIEMELDKEPKHELDQKPADKAGGEEAQSHG